MVTGGAPGPAAEDCELCRQSRITPWFYEDDLCWIAECEACWVPMVVWKQHDPDPDGGIRVMLHERLAAVVSEHYEYSHWIDENMRTIPTHYHAHARPLGGFMGYGLRRTRPG